MRIRDYFNMSFKEAVRQPVRSTLTITSIAISSAILVALVSISIGGQEAVNKQLGFDQNLNTILVTPNINVSTGILGNGIQIANQETEKLDMSSIRKLANIDGVKKIQAQIGLNELREFYLDGSEKHFVSKAITIADYENNDTLKDSDAFSVGSEEIEILLGQSYAKELGYSSNSNELIGKHINFVTYNGYSGYGATIPAPNTSAQERLNFNNSPTEIRAKIVGISNDARYENQLIVAYSWAEKIKTYSYYKDSELINDNKLADVGYNTIVLHANNISDVKQISSTVSSLNYGVISTQDQIERISQYSIIVWLILGSVSLISLVASCLAISNTMFMTINEERYLIGVWRACGATKKVIKRLFIIETFLLSLVGSLLGVSIGYFVSFLVNSKIQVILESQGIIDVQISAPSWIVITSSLLIAIAISTLAGVYPSHKAAKQDPSSAITSY